MGKPHSTRLADLAGTSSAGVPAPKRSLIRRLFPALLFLALVALLLLVARDRFTKTTTVRTATVVTKFLGSEVQGQVATVSVQAPGWVEPDPYATYAGALASGIIEEVLVLEGDSVKKGDPIARLISDDASLQVQQAKAALARQRATLAAAQSDWDHPIELDRRVSTAKAKQAEIDAQLAELTAIVAQKDAERAEAQQILDRLKSVKSGIVTVLEVERATHQLAAKEAALHATQKRKPVFEAMKNSLAVELAAATRARELRIMDRQRLDEAKAAVASAEATLAEAELRLSRMVVKAPADGVVMTRLKSPGSKVMLDMDSPHSSHVVHLYDPQKLQIRVDVPLADAAKVQLDQEATVIVDVLPDVTFSGKVTRFVHAADLSKNTVQAKVAVESPSALLKPEMLARVKFLAAKPKANEKTTGSESVLVPTAALQNVQDETATVWVTSPDQKTASQRKIDLTGTYQDTWRIVSSGLNPGDVVIIDPPATLEDGGRISATQGGL